MKQRLLFIFLVLLSLGQAMRVSADDFVQTASNYTCMQMGIDKLRFTLPTQYDGVTNQGVQDGHIYIMVDNGPKQDLLQWKCKDYSDLEVGYQIKAYQGGTFQLVGQAKSWRTFTPDDNWVNYELKPDASNPYHYTTTVDWTIPREFRGHHLTISLWAHVNWSAAGDWHVPDAYSNHILLNWDAPESAQTGAQLSEFTLAYGQKQVGKIMSVYSFNAKSVNWALLHYTDAVTGARGFVKLDNKLVGFAYLPMDRPYTNVYVEASVIDSEGYDVMVTSETISVPMLHIPNNLSVKLTPEGHAIVNWLVDEPQQEDLQPYDQFEIQRNINGPDVANGWQVCGSVSFDKGTSTYTYEDPDLLELFRGTPVAYRVRRTCTGIWGWSDGSGGVTSVLNTIPVLPKIENATVVRSSTWNDESHVADFAFDFGPSRDNIDSYILRTADDFEAFANRVNSGEKHLRAVMAADIDLGDRQVMVGTARYPFIGSFRGNGHTLTVAYNSTNEDVAPFSHISGGTVIRDLTVAGSATSSSKYVGGLVGRVMNTTGVLINNCRVSVAISSSASGESVNGGFVARCTSGTLEISNCRFDGQFLGENSYNNGGFVGWTDSKVKLTNCLFVPTRITTKYDGCKTFARARNSSDLTLNNCNYTFFYDNEEKTIIENKEYYILRNADDWNRFREKVKSSNGNSDVNAIMMADFQLTEPIGQTESQPYRGIFYGNGHTLDIALANDKMQYMAPFLYAKDATFRNLRVTGNVHGNLLSSGLVGLTLSGSSSSFHNTRVSANITCTGNQTSGPRMGGFIGDSKGASIYIENCLFDGALIANTRKDSYGGAFVGWGDGSWFFERNYENGTYVNIEHVGMNYRSSKAWGGSSSSCSAHNWGEMYSDANRNVTDPAKAVEILGSKWKLEDNVAVPIMSTEQVGQGINVVTYNSAALAGLMGNEWYVDGGEAVPAINRFAYDDGFYDPIVWDPRAKLQLRINMHGENGVTSNLIDLNNREDIFKTHRFSQELSRKCVEYSFDLILRRDTSPLSIIGTDNDTLAVAVKKIDEGDLAKYRFLNSDSIRNLKAVTKQSSVELTWESSGGDRDFFRVLRKDKINREAQWEELVTNLQTLYYEDKTVLSQHTYLYRVESVFQCEGAQVNSTEIEGFCATTGMVNGYVRLSDGTAMAGVKVRVEPIDSLTKAIAPQPWWDCFTDSIGYYEVRGLPFRGNGRYSAYVPTDGGSSSFTGGATVNFSANNNWYQNINFYMDEYVVYSGNVYYRDTTIPVPGVSFKMDGKPLYNASGKIIETDTQGAFELSIPKGQHSVQAVKQGHIFAADGFLIDEDDPEASTRYNFAKNISGAYIWDSTTVMLRGRVVGGDVQGDMLLGQSLSTNNLGDSIKIVMQLEGDNTSWLIRKQDDDSVVSANYDVHFGQKDQDVANINITRHTLTIRPDKHTGEYQLKLHPAKYKVIEISAQGYATLFQAGKVGETLDLSTKEDGDTCEYNRIYHSVPDVDVKQVNNGSEPYFGFKTYTASNTVGYTSKVNVWYKDSLDVEHYSFGYPVFMANSPYGWQLQACEKYYYNNNFGGKVDIVNLNGGKVKIQNALTTDSKTSEIEVELDENGGGQYIFVPDNTTFMLEDDMALKTVSITLEYDGNYYDIKPLNGNLLRGYVMAVKPIKEGQYTVAVGVPQLVDILRDPPGGGSSSYIETGSKMSSSYNFNIDAAAGFKLTNTTIKNKNTILNGAVVAPQGSGTFSGTINESESRTDFIVSFITNYTGSWNWSYNYDVTERIQTSSGKTWVGDKADLFIGHNENIILFKAMAVRAIPEDQYLLMKTHEGGSFTITDKDGATTTVKVPVGTVKVLATGTDNDRKPIYLVRDEVIAASPKVKSTFVHSQNYIEKELLPALMNLRNSLIYPMDANLDFQSMANQQDKPFYKSKVAADDPNFGSDNSYESYFPESSSKVFADTIHALNEEMYIWINYLALNEKEKLEVSPDRLVENYEFDGAANIQYSENFSVSRTDAGQVKYPLVQNVDLMGTLPSLFSTFKLFKDLNKIDSWSQDPEPKEASVRETNDQEKVLDVAVGGTGFTLKWAPIFAFNTNAKNSQGNTHTKKIGFTLSAAAKASLNVDVYRTKRNYWDIDTDSESDKANHVVLDSILFFTKDNLSKQHLGNMYKPDYSTWTVYSNLVFRTRGGVTSEPYEDARTTKWYQPGTVLDVATVPIDRPHIWIDQPVVSNVPYDEPARFTLHFANESDYPDRVSREFNYYLLPSSNPKGATVCVDGKPLSSGGEVIRIYPAIGGDGKPCVYTKEVAVYPSAAYDYEDLTICLVDPNDPTRIYSTKLSAHFIPSAGKVNISMPGNNWVVNTESPYDAKQKGWYLPVRIDGFDVNYPGFDHVELQYKLSTQGDKDWVSTCAYYANDSLRAKASGVTDTIPSNGIIMARFFGEKDPIEQNYELRAVNYCRYAGGYLTRSSAILPGIKDTRLPELFGTPHPVSGILDIGEDIMLSFSEPIAGNYLSKINNFELLGTPLNNDISTSTSLSFSAGAHSTTQGSRNLEGKSFTVDIMLNPVKNDKDMVVFLHGGEENGLRFGLTADRRLSATVNGQTVESDSIVPFSNAMRQVAYVLDQSGSDMKVNFFDGSLLIGSKTLTGKYKGSSPIMLGSEESKTDGCYTGDMLEFRLWNRAMTGPQINTYSRKRLTGYESGLLDYYPMNEGKGEYCYDKAAGSLDLYNRLTTWKRPSGISMKFDGTEGLRLNPVPFDRSSDHDYTLMFWFRTLESNATLLSNGKAKTKDIPDQINVGIDDGDLYVRSSGYERRIEKAISDGGWHHFALTVSRSHNVANVYVDLKLLDTFVADSIQGISSDHVALGATYEDKNTPTGVLKGNIDEVGLFASVLPLNLLDEFSTHTPIPTMTSLMAYLNFGSSEHGDNNVMRLEPTGVSLKRYKDSQGNVLERRDTLIAVIDERFVDRANQAPIVNSAQLENLNFSYVTDGQNLLVNLKEPAHLLEKTNVYLTVKQLPDLRGNLMASPVTMSVYVYRNPLRWNVKSINRDLRYGEGATIELTVRNLSGERQDYELLDLPVWISASQTSGVISALDEQTITLKVSPYINIGTYTEQVSLMSGNGMCEPLPITLNVRGDEPTWAVSDRLLQLNQTMMMVARVYIDGQVDCSPEDIVGVFDDDFQTMGVAHIEVDQTANANEALAYITIYGYTNPDKTKPHLNFRLFQASTGKIHTLFDHFGHQYTFQRDSVIGTASEPVVLSGNYSDVQTMRLKKGWNWVSFCNYTAGQTTVKQFLDGSNIWEVGDIIMTINGTTTQQWSCRQDKTSPRGYKWDHENDLMTINPAQTYFIYSCSDKMVTFEGIASNPKISVQKGWNRIGYTSPINLPIAQAMSDYIDNASDGDILKSQEGFAVASRTSSGLVWKGSLQYMEAGKGYMMKRLGSNVVSFKYPLYYGDNRYDGFGEQEDGEQEANTFTTMNIVARVSGVEVEPGDRLAVYLGGQRMTSAQADDSQLYYLNIGADTTSGQTLTFVIERSDEVVAMTASRISYTADALLGTPDEPTDISFVPLSDMPNDGKWYNISGIQLPKKPTVSGLYIHNGKVVTVKRNHVHSHE